MHVEAIPADHAPERSDLVLGDVRYSSFTEHDLRDIESALAARRAMSKRCPAVSGEHTCGLDPGHGIASRARLRLGYTLDGWRTVPASSAGADPHLCRACPEEWEDGKP
jgi:hypothetical protein